VKKILSPETLVNRPDVNGKDAFGSTALHEASFFGHDDIVRLLIKAGAHVLARDTDGATALHKVNKSTNRKKGSLNFDFRQQQVIVHRHCLF
jgi:ankyrin repeat protein